MEESKDFHGNKNRCNTKMKQRHGVDDIGGLFEALGYIFTDEK